MDVEAPTAVRQAEVGAVRIMIERKQDRFATRPEELVADGAYGSAENLAWRDEGERPLSDPLSLDQQPTPHRLLQHDRSTVAVRNLRFPAYLFAV